MYHTFNFVDHLDEYTYDDHYVYCSTSGCRLRRHDASLNYSPAGLFSTSTIDLPNINGLAIREFTGLAIEEYIPPGTSIGYRASIDNGTTWRWFDGSAWQTPGANDWSTLAQIDAGIATLGGRQLRVRIRLVPTTAQTSTPAIARVHIFYEAVWGFFEDLKRSLKRLIDTTIVVHLTWSTIPSAATSSIPLVTPWSVIGVDEVYNTTADPNRLTNIFSSFTPGTPGTVALTTPVPGGNTVEVHFRGRCEVFLAADENLQISVVPAVVVVIPRAREDKHASKNLFEYEPLVSKVVVRRRERVVPISSTVMIYAIGATEVDSLATQDALAEIFEPEPTFKSQAVGEDFFCLTYDPLIDNDIVSTGLHVKATQILVLGNKDLRSYTDVPPVTVIGDEYVGAGQMGEPGERVPVSSVAVPNDASTRLNPICATLPSETGIIQLENGD